MNYDEFQSSVQIAVDGMTADVLIAAMNRLQQQIEHRYATEADVDIADYTSLLEVYTHLKLYQHRLNKRVEGFPLSRSMFPAHVHNEWGVELDKCNYAIQNLKHYKTILRSRLIHKGVNHKTYHPHIHTFKPEKIAQAIRLAPQNSLTNNQTTCILPTWTSAQSTASTLRAANGLPQ